MNAESEKRGHEPYAADILHPRADVGYKGAIQRERKARISKGLQAEGSGGKGSVVISSAFSLDADRRVLLKDIALRTTTCVTR